MFLKDEDSKRFESRSTIQRKYGRIGGRKYIKYKGVE